MLYKCPGSHFLHGINCDYIIVPSNQADQWIAKGWSYSPTEADELFKNDIEDCAETMNEAEIPEYDRYLYYEEPVEEKPKQKLKYEDFSDLEKDNIRRDKRPMKLLSEIHNTSYYTIRKIKGLT